MTITSLGVAPRNLTLYHGTNLGSVKSILKTGLGVDSAYYLKLIIRPIAKLFGVDPDVLFRLVIPKRDIESHSEYRGSVSLTSEFDSSFFGSYLTDILAKGGEFRHHTFWRAIQIACKQTGTKLADAKADTRVRSLEKRTFGSTTPVIIEVSVPYTNIRNPEDYGTSYELVTKGPIPSECIVAVYSPAPTKDQAKVYWKRP